MRHAKKKVSAALRTIKAIRELDFPYSDSKHALDFIKGNFDILYEDLEGCSTDSDPATVKALCQRSLETIQRYLPILGFIVRSTVLDGPLELQGPLLRLTCRAIGYDARLIISSEWEFSPFTILYPELIDRNFVVVGMPYSEANNALIAPLAGHELGHNIWEKGCYEARFKDLVRDQIVAQIKKKWEYWRSVFSLDNPDQLTELKGEHVLSEPWSWAIAQCEETFCDFVGLLIFRESYLHAFEYLLAPGLSGPRGYRYPRLKDRISALLAVAPEVDIQPPADYEEHFEDCEHDPEPWLRELGQLSDTACKELRNRLFSDARNFVAEHNLSSHDSEEVDRIYHALRRAVPACDAKSISDIISAAWRLALENEGFLASEYPGIDEAEESIVLNELLLKSF